MYRPRASSQSPTAVRGSIGTPVTRLTRVAKRTTCAARAKAAATAASSPASESTHRLVLASSHTSGAAGATASSEPTTAGRGS